jgi:negative regulator of flagellin synthesis FlgM
MKIYDKRFPEGKELTSGVNKVTGTENLKGNKPVKRTSTNDKVDISERAKEIAKLMEEVKSLPEVREDRVRELKALIEAGGYQIDPRKIAERLIEEL